MAMITPTRFGLKYAPIPTLALEYEENLGVLQDDDGTRSLYVLKETKDGKPKVRKKLHVVELPQLTGRSEPLDIVRQLQKDNQRFLGPSVVREQQLQRLLQHLVDHLDGKSEEHTSDEIHPTTLATEQHDKSEELQESAMEESIVEASASMDASRADEEEPSPPPMTLSSGGGKFVTQEESDREDDQEASKGDDEAPVESNSTREAEPVKRELSEEELKEAEEDEKKRTTLKSESGASDDEDVQSEELEYFSEDGSDEDSF